MWKTAKNCKLHQSILSPFSVSKTKLLKGSEVKKNALSYKKESLQFYYVSNKV